MNQTSIQPISRDTPPQFPCWLWDWLGFWCKHHQLNDWEHDTRYSHWHPDQPKPPIEKP